MAVGCVLLAVGHLSAHVVKRIRSGRNRAGTLQEPLLTSDMLGEGGGDA